MPDEMLREVRTALTVSPGTTMLVGTLTDSGGSCIGTVKYYFLSLLSINENFKKFFFRTVCFTVHSSLTYKKNGIKNFWKQHLF